MKKYVITGGPGVGKTSVIEELSKKGFYVVSETARELIEKNILINSNIVPWIDLDAFNNEVLKIQEEKEKLIPEYTQTVFLDRGIIDALGYYSAAKKEPIPELKKAVLKVKYDQIFLLEQLPNHVNDEIRREDSKKAWEINEEIAKAYNNLGFEVIRIPLMSIEERTKIILKNIRK